MLSYYSFNPQNIPWQWPALQKIVNLDYSLGTHEIALNGIVGSAKTTLAAWLTIDHCFKYSDANFFIGRRSYQDLRDTSFQEIFDLLYNHFGDEVSKWANLGSCSFLFPWGAKITGGTWGDGRYEKYKSKRYSGAWIEEPTENGEDEYNGLMNILRPRIGRIGPNNSDVQENFMVLSYNAHDPEHPVYKEFHENQDELTHLIISDKKDNPYLHEKYYENLLKRLDPLNVQRQIHNKWITSSSGGIYHAYDESIHYIRDDYQIDNRHPIRIGWDFNIGDGKPLSLVMAQLIDDTFHFFDEVIIEGVRTADSCLEISNRGYLDMDIEFILNGDATGRARDTRSKGSDWQIIKSYFANHVSKPKFSMKVPTVNPPIRKRHNKVNSYMQNGLGESRIKVYQKCKTLNKGFKFTAFKKGSSIEDDSAKCYYQHCTTSAGYLICAAIKPDYKNFATTTKRW